MRLYEILSEEQNKDRGTPGLVNKDFEAVSPGMTAFKQLRNTDPYMQYRMGVALASASGGQSFDQESAYAENFLTVNYTDAEEDIVNKAASLMGVTATTLAKRKSTEPAGTNKASPVAKPKRNRYGV
jgi:hypothetical protein